MAQGLRALDTEINSQQAQGGLQPSVLTSAAF